METSFATTKEGQSMKLISEHEFEELWLIKTYCAKLGYAIKAATLKRDTPEEKKAAEQVDYWMKQLEPNFGVMKIETTKEDKA